jgi:hypothetical protein
MKKCSVVNMHPESLFTTIYSFINLLNYDKLVTICACLLPTLFEHVNNTRRACFLHFLLYNRAPLKGVTIFDATRTIFQQNLFVLLNEMFIISIRFKQ